MPNPTARILAWPSPRTILTAWDDTYRLPASPHSLGRREHAGAADGHDGGRIALPERRHLRQASDGLVGQRAQGRFGVDVEGVFELLGADVLGRVGAERLGKGVDSVEGDPEPAGHRVTAEGVEVLPAGGQRVAHAEAGHAASRPLPAVAVQGDQHGRLTEPIDQA